MEHQSKSRNECSQRSGKANYLPRLRKCTPIPNNCRYGIARKTFARKMAIRPSTFSMYLCDTERPWSSCGDAQKKFMLTLFQWLNLDLADRVGVFYEAAELLQR